ncbi:MAG: GntR family transcriptional regulator [Acidobacteria bacterium]|nr:GntR family transcriptional regulator [Acidobacteriota bacterium]
MFLVDGSSSIPVHVQLRDQVKFAIGVGRLRVGDTLPSVRDLERQLAIDKNKIWRAYQDLAKAGYISLRQGKGAQVNSALPLEVGSKKRKSCEQLCQKVLGQLSRDGIHPASFVSYFQHQVLRALGGGSVIFAECNRTETELFAQQIGEIWSVDVRGVMISELRSVLGKTISQPGLKVVTNAFHLEEVRNLLKGTAAEVIGLNFHWHRKMSKAIEALEEPASLVFVFTDPDKRGYGKLIEKELRAMVSGRRISITIAGISEIGDLARFCRSGNHDLILFSNRLWDELPAEIKKLRFVSRPTLQIDPASLEEARVRVGVIW